MQPGAQEVPRPPGSVRPAGPGALQNLLVVKGGERHLCKINISINNGTRQNNWETLQLHCRPRKEPTKGFQWGEEGALGLRGAR